MKRNLLTLLVLFGFVATTGCALFVAGAGIGAGAYTYLNGELTRSYPATFDKTVQACTDTLKKLKITTTDNISDGLKTQINAKRSDNTPVTVTIVMIAPRITEVGIRSGVIGVWDKKVSELIHASIAQRLQQ